MKSRLVLKCVGIFTILILFTIVLNMVEYKVEERQSYREQATRTVANGWSQEQLIAGPLFELKFTRTYSDKQFNKELKKYVEVEKKRHWSEYHLLETLNVSSELKMQERYVGIFNVPVYTANIALSGQHNASSLQHKRNHLVSAKLLVSMNDMRGLANQPELMWNNQRLEFTPGDQQKLLGNYIQSNVPLTLLNQDASINFQLTLRGVNSIGFVPTAQNVLSTLTAAWPHPSFTGRYLPSERRISEQGFSANWGVNSFASSIAKVLKRCQTEANQCASHLGQNQFGVHLGAAVDVYQMTDRALKYGFLFICLTFVVFSLLELQQHHRIHPIQYGFVGAALAVFYLLIISLSEHVNFALAYLIGSIGCTLLICAYLKVVLSSTKLALALGTAFLSLYAMMYAILQSEDYAFLMGTLLIFALLAGIMYATRGMNWQQFSNHNATIEPVNGSPVGG